MPGGPIIIIDPNKIKSTMNLEDTIARIREVLSDLESGAADVEAMDDDRS